MPVTRSTSGTLRTPLLTFPLPERSPRRGRGVKPLTPDIIILSDHSDDEIARPKRKGVSSSSKKVTEKQRGKAKAKPFVVIGDILEVSSDDDSRPASKSPKRATNTTTIVDLQNQVKKLQHENTQLKHECSRLKENSLQDVSTLEDHLTCEICTLNLWSPYIIAECGHTFCQTCLQDWFGKILNQHVHAYPHYDVNANNIGINAPINLALRQIHVNNVPQPQPPYTCPYCRAEVKTKPVEEYALKAMIRIVAAARGEQSPKQQDTVARIGAAQREGPWDKFFRRTT